MGIGGAWAVITFQIPTAISLPNIKPLILTPPEGLKFADSADIMRLVDWIGRVDRIDWFVMGGSVGFGRCGSA